MSKTVSFLRDSNISEYINIMSSEEVIKSLLQSESAKKSVVFTTDKVDREGIETDDELIKILADVFQSLTTKAMTTKDIVEYIYDNYKPDEGAEAIGKIESLLGDSVKIVHAQNYDLTTINSAIKSFSQASVFNIPKRLPAEFLNGATTLFMHDNRYGLTQIKNILNKEGKLSLAFANETDNMNYNVNKNILFSCEEMIDAKVKTTDSSGVGAVTEKTIFNGTKNNKLIQDKDNTSVSVVMLNNPNIRAGTKNSLELSTFLNVLSTIELSKCIPYFNATFILPDAVQNLSGKIFKTASITQFLEGSLDVPWDNATSDFYNTIEASFIKEINKGTETVTTSGATTNMSIFTMPQTVNNFDEAFIGHNDVLQLNKNRIFQRANPVHDITRPFLTIKSFNIDVAPTQGLMSFKTGKISLVLHDRTRMVDIAPFIKPDLFGSFGAEICIEYGWSHLDAQKFSNELSDREVNYISEFLDKNRVIEKFIITNSSYRINSNGQVDIDLSIAMRGPVDIRTVYVDIDAPKKISHSRSQRIKRKFAKRKDDLATTMGGESREKAYAWMNNRVHQVLMQDLFSITDSANYEYEIVRKINAFTRHFTKFKKKKKSINNYIKINSSIKYKDFTEFLNKQWKEADPNLNTNYFDEDFEPFKYGNIFVEEENEVLTESKRTREELIKRTSAIAQQKIYISKTNAESLLAFIFDNNNSYASLLSSVASSITGVIRARKKKQNELVKKLIGGLGRVDPFFDKHLYAEYLLYAEENYNDVKIKKIEDSIKKGFLPIYGIKPYGDVDVDLKIEAKRNKKSNFKVTTEFVTFGCVITAIITSHLSCLGKFDEIQLVSYTVNSYAGIMSNRNIMSFLIDRNELQKFLFKLFSKEAKFTIESLMTQICQRFISTRDQPCYGLSGLYTRDGDKSIKPKNSNTNKHQQSVNDALQRIYTKGEKSLSLDEIVFQMPKIKFSFDTLSTKESGYLKTISRISIFDQQDNPFGSVKQIMEKVYDENIITAAARINKLRAETLSKKDNEKEKQNKITKGLDEFYKKANNIVKELINKGILELEGDSFRVRGSFKSNSLKQEFKRIMPSATYGSQNTALLEASVSTINEANLNTVYLTRPDRNLPGEAAKITFGNDLPLRILPSQADITMYGCPFVNFAQYMFLDFETGTTIDNTYAVTGIKHDMSPGKFTTTLNLSYGDVYGKYENAVKTISKYLPENKEKDLSLKILSGSVNIAGITGKTLPDNIQVKALPSVDNITYILKPNNTDTIKIDLQQSIFSYKSNEVYVNVSEKRSKENQYDIKLNYLIDYNTTYNKVINYKINLSDNNKIEALNDIYQKLALTDEYFYFFNKKMIESKITENKFYIVSDAKDIIKLCFRFTDLFLNPKAFGLGFYYSSIIKPLTSGLYEFNQTSSKIQVDLPSSFSLYNILKNETHDFNWNSDIMTDINNVFFGKDGLIAGNLLHVRFKDKNKTIRKIKVNKKLVNDKLKLEVSYDLRTRKGVSKETENIYYSLTDDLELSRYFRQTIVNVFKNELISFNVEKDD